MDTLLRSDSFPHAQTHRELKELLYHRIIDHFDKGKVMIIINIIGAIQLRLSVLYLGVGLVYKYYLGSGTVSGSGPVE